MRRAYRGVTLRGTKGIAPYCCCRVVAVLLPCCSHACHRCAREGCSNTLTSAAMQGSPWKKKAVSREPEYPGHLRGSCEQYDSVPVHSVARPLTARDEMWCYPRAGRDRGDRKTAGEQTVGSRFWFSFGSAQLGSAQRSAACRRARMMHERA